MKVAFNARLLYSPTLRGWNRYTINLLAALAELDVELFLYGSHEQIHPDHLHKLPQGSYQVRIAPPMNYLQWEQYWLPQQCQKDGVDILHCPLNFGLPWFSPCPRVLTLHDIIGQVFTAPKQPWSKKITPGAIKNRLFHWIARERANQIITVSNYSKQDIVKHFQIPADKITVIYEGADANFHQAVTDSKRIAIRQKYQLATPYIFYVGGWEERKNIPFLLQAFAEAQLSEIKLVLAGGRDNQKSQLQALATSLGIEHQLQLLGWVEEEDLPMLYAEALCFVYPSQYEGFGLQLCEAMAVGCPVLAANSTCLPEILGTGGETFSLAGITELSGLLSKVATDSEFRQQLQQRSQQRSQSYSWQRTASETIQVYQNLLKIKG